MIGLPLADPHQGVFGALLLGGLRALDADAAIVDALYILASHLSLHLRLKRARDEGYSGALHDVLTGLPNRLQFNEILDAVLREVRSTGERFAIAFVDVDRFKQINDSLGHAVGDQVLIAVGKRLRSSTRGTDVVARYAGDEFTILLRNVAQREDVVRVAEKIVHMMEVPLAIGPNEELHATVSLGVAFYPDDATSADALLRQADLAMYSAKALGRNRFQIYVAEGDDPQQQRVELESNLRAAERNGELHVYYQAQVDADSEDIVGMEALLRWQHPDLGMISPGMFIPLAEDSGQILALGEWVLRRACEDTRAWQRRFGLPLRLSVNLSPLQLRDPRLISRVEQILAETDFSAQLLEFEVTENISLKSIPNLLETLHGLRALGCQISIDDFGTGQSSLDYLKHFPADRIKIDQVFVRNIGVDPDDEAIVQATLSMAHNLNRQVVAEGVETEMHLEFLRDHHCDVLQGFLFSRPLSAAKFQEMLAERQLLLGRLRRSTHAA
jgi:diguanylate cyclase (GGDEF)-like protein